MAEEAKIYQRSEFLSAARHILSYIDGWHKREAHFLVGLCDSCTGLIFSIYKTDKKILRDLLVEYKSDVSEINFSQLEESAYSSGSGQYKDGALFWGEMLQCLNLIDKSVKFCQRLLDWHHSLRTYSTTPRLEWSPNAKYENAFSQASKVVINTIIVVTIEALIDDAQKYPSSWLPIMKHRLDEMRDYIVWNCQASGPYILGDGNCWDSGLVFPNLDRTLGILSLRSLLDQKEVECTFKYDMENKVEIVSWTVSANEIWSYVSQLFETWLYDSGTYFQYPKIEGHAWWAIGNNEIADLVSFTDCIEECVVHLLKAQKHQELARSVQEILGIRTQTWEPEQIPWTYIKELDEISDKLRFTMKEVSKPSRNKRQKQKTEQNHDGQKGVKKDSYENLPNDLLTLLVAVKEYAVSRTTLKRAIADGRLKSYRPPNAAPNAPHKVSRTEVGAIWPKIS